MAQLGVNRLDFSVPYRDVRAAARKKRYSAAENSVFSCHYPETIV